MKDPALILCFCFLASGLLAVAPYPSTLTVKYKDQMLPVVRVKKTDPVVMVGGKEKVIGSVPTYTMQGATGFADNFVDASPGTLGGPFQIRFLGGGGAPTSFMNYIEVPLTARKTIKRGFAAVLIYADISKSKDLREKAFMMSDTSPKLADPFFTGTTIIVHDLPELPAGKTVKAKFTAGGAVALLATDYFIQIFDDEGREVRTPDVELAWEFYSRRDQDRLATAVAKYLEKFKGADHDAVPAIMPKPIFPPEAVKPTGEVVIGLTVEANGTVSAVDAASIADESTRAGVVQALGGWLFLPKLKAGQPVSTMVNVPLQF